MDLLVRNLLADPLDALGGVQRALVEGEFEVPREQMPKTSPGGMGEDVGVLCREQQIVIVN